MNLCLPFNLVFLERLQDREAVLTSGNLAYRCVHDHLVAQQSFKPDSGIR